MGEAVPEVAPLAPVEPSDEAAPADMCSTTL